MTDMGQKFGEDLERYRVIAWLREQASKARYKDQRLCAIEFANAIERDEHRAASVDTLPKGQDREDGLGAEQG